MYTLEPFGRYGFDPLVHNKVCFSLIPHGKSWNLNYFQYMTEKLRYEEHLRFKNLSLLDTILEILEKLLSTCPTIHDLCGHEWTVYDIRKSLPKKRFSFTHCQKRGGRGPARHFFTNYIFSHKWECSELWTAFQVKYLRHSPLVQHFCKPSMNRETWMISEWEFSHQQCGRCGLRNMRYHQLLPAGSTQYFNIWGANRLAVWGHAKFTLWMPHKSTVFAIKKVVQLARIGWSGKGGR